MEYSSSETGTLLNGGCGLEHLCIPGLLLAELAKNKRLKIKGGGTGVGFGCKLVKVNLEHADRRPHSNGVSHYTALRHPSVVSGFRLPQCI